MKKILFILSLFINLPLLAQNEASNWYFGEGAGIRFDATNGTVTSVDGGRLNTREGCASISDETGLLLFYTDGKTVYNRNHEIMSNGAGLYGDWSSSQSAIIVPKPGNENIYYIFTVDNQLDGEDFGLNYSIVDISLNDGLGTVTDKNINLLQICTEKISAVLKDCINETYWVVTLSTNDGKVGLIDSFHAFEVSESGVSSNSVVSKFENLSVIDKRGYLKLSPDGSVLACANAQNGLFIYDFNVNNGTVSNQQRLNINSINGNPYGIEFSPNNRFLYVNSSNDYFNRENPEENNNPENHFSVLSQFDLFAANIQDSEFTIEERQLYRGGLQLGPDGRIYRALSETYNRGLPYLGVINSPNLKGNACNYQHNAIHLSPNASSQGLPPFVQSLFATKIDILGNKDSSGSKNLNLCEGDEYTLQSNIYENAIYSWLLDGELLPETSNSLTISSSGHYQLFIDPNNGDCPIEGEAYVSVHENPISMNATLFQCDEDGIYDGLTAFNLHEADAQLTNGEQNRTTKFYLESQHAIDDLNEIDGYNFQNTEIPQTIYVKVIDKLTQCFSFSELTLNVSATSATNGQLFECDYLGDDDGIAEFDLTEANKSVILGITEDVEIVYYETYEDALLEVNPLDYKYTNTKQPYNQIIYVRVENDNACYGINEVELTVYELPRIAEDESFYFCLNIPDLAIPVDAGLLEGHINDFEYLWSTGETTYNIDIDQPGDFEVTVTNKSTGCMRSRVLQAITSNTAAIDNIDVVDAVPNNTMTIQVSGEGDYEFALNNKFGPYQDDNFFENVPAGINTVYVRDKNGCGIVSENFPVIGFPKFFTPNNDRYNDTWHVYGINDPMYFESKVYIFDRYGKLLKELSPRDTGWDGTFNGNPLPTSDYWFYVKLQDGRIFRSHFTLKR